MNTLPLSPRNLCALIATLFVLTACGGGGGGSTTPTTPAPTNPTTPPPAPMAEISGPQTSVLEKTSVTLVGSSNLTGDVTFTWTQLWGPEVNAVANGNTLTFTTPSVFGLNTDSVVFTLVASQGELTSDAMSFEVYVDSAGTFEDYADTVATVTLGAKDSYLQLTELARQSINRIAQADATTRAVCNNGGEENVAHTDTDANGMVSASDIIRVTFTDCLSPVLDAYVMGYVDITVTAASQTNKTLSGSIALDNLSISDQYDTQIMITMQGDMNFTLAESVTSRDYSVANDTPITFSILGQPFLSVSNASLSKGQDLASAKYSIEVNANMTDYLTDFTYNVNTDLPLSGYVGEYPNSGSITVGQTGGEEFTIQPNNIIDSDMFKLLVAERTIPQRWSEYVENTMFAFDNVSYSTSEYRIDNFMNIGQIQPFLQFSDIQAPNITLMTSRPIARVEDANLTVRLDGFPYTEVPVEVIQNGAIVTIRPTVPLLAGRRYQIYGIELYSEFGASAYMSFLELVTSDAVIPNITASSRAYRQNDYPILDASNSLLNQGSTLNYRWAEVTNTGVTFSDANAAVTNIDMPTNINDSVTDDIVIRLTVSNETGRTAQSDITLNYQPAPSSYISLVSAEGDYIGQGALWFLNQPIAFSSESTNQTPSELVLNYDGGSSSWWMNIQSADGAPLAIGEYSAQRWPFQGPGFAGFDFSGDGRGCNELTADFKIIELAYASNGDLAQLSVDFTQYCEYAGAPPLRGQVRFNSSMRINP